jgi:hypothetical protein
MVAFLFLQRYEFENYNKELDVADRYGWRRFFIPYI